MVSDTIADMLTRIRNANRQHKLSVNVPHSMEKERILKVLKQEGFISSFAVFQEGVAKNMNVELKYSEDKELVIHGLRRVSKPGLRVYSSKEELPRVFNGLGIAVISTSKGIMSDRQARKAGLGGEVLCYVW